MANKFSSNVPNLSTIYQRALDLTIQEVGAAVQEEARETAPVNNGFYKAGIEFDGRSKVIAKMNYSAALEYGVAPRTIRANSKKSLHFVIDGKDIFVKSVRQKARPPRPTMRNAARKVQKESGGLFLKNWNRLKASV